MTATPDEPLQLFTPPTAEWFGARFGEPTDIQKRAWPRIAAAPAAP